MFVSDSHLPQVLDAEDYRSPERCRREVEKLFMPAWHLVGTMCELPRDGDFLTSELLDHPLLVWRMGDCVHAYLNVCAHRSCLLTHAPRGCTPRIKCQYHGWEYDEAGNTRRIPDARSFRPMEPGMVGLKKFRTATVGRCIFVTLDDAAPDIQEFLGPAYDLIREVTDGPWQFLGVGDRPLEANWKVYIENTIETYHVASVHPKSLREIPDESTCQHEFDERWSLLKTFGKPESLDWLDALAHRVLGVERDPDYHNLLIYPHITVGKMSLFSWVDQVLPDGPNRTRVVARGFSHTGKHGFWRSGLMAYFVRRFGRKFMEQIVREDSAVMPSVQRGLRSPMQPAGGLISIREERIFHFQNFVHNRLHGNPDAIWSSRSA